mgnify:CR=1 FL=1
MYLVLNIIHRNQLMYCDQTSVSQLIINWDGEVLMIVLTLWYSRLQQNWHPPLRRFVMLILLQPRILDTMDIMQNPETVVLTVTDHGSTYQCKNIGCD